MSSRLAAIKARCAAATPGPWREGRHDTGTARWTANAAFIAHSRTDLPALVELCEALLAEREARLAADMTDDGTEETEARLAVREFQATQAADAAIRRFEEGA